MEALELLEREKQFRKLNAQLEANTANLIKEIENVMDKQDDIGISGLYSRSFENNIDRKLSTTRAHQSDAERGVSTIIATDDNRRTTPRDQASNASSAQRRNSKLKDNKNDPYLGDRNSARSKQGGKCECRENYEQISPAAKLEVFLEDFVKSGIQEKVLPESFKKEKLCVEVLCKFMLSKLNLLQGQIDTLETTFGKKASVCEELLRQNASLESTRMRLQSQLNTAKTQVTAKSNKVTALEGQLKDKNKENLELRKECEKLRKDALRGNGDRARCDLRQKNAEDDILKLKQELDAAAKTEQDLRDSTRKLTSSFKSTIAGLEKQKEEFLSAFRKQMLLIDNLRQQNDIIVQQKNLDLIERDFMDLLNFRTQFKLQFPREVKQKKERTICYNMEDRMLTFLKDQLYRLPSGVAHFLTSHWLRQSIGIT